MIKSEYFVADTEVSLEYKKRQGERRKKKWPKMFSESEQRPKVEIRRQVECEAVWQLQELQVEERDAPSPKKKKVLNLFKELK